MKELFKPRPLDIIVPKIEATKDYGCFHYIECNRGVKDAHMKRLAEAMKKQFLLPYCPIIVTNEYGIIDGQHRYAACVRDDLPLYYVVADMTDNEAADAIVALNTNTNAWRQEEYLEHHAELQGGRWADLKSFWLANRWLGISNAVVIYPDKHINAAQVKDGVVMFGRNPHLERIMAFLTAPEVSAMPKDIVNQRYFVCAVRRFVEDNSDRAVNKLRDGILRVKKCARMADYTTTFENIVKARRM